MDGKCYPIFGLDDSRGHSLFRNFREAVFLSNDVVWLFHDEYVTIQEPDKFVTAKPGPHRAEKAPFLCPMKYIP